MIAPTLLTALWLVCGFLVARVVGGRAAPPRYPNRGVVIPERVGRTVLTDAEVVDLFLKVDWRLRLDQPVPMGREW